MIIVESGLESASATDILGGTRLENVPSNGNLILEFSASANDASNQHVVTTKLPDGDTPLIDTPVPAGRGTGDIDDDLAMSFNFGIEQGGRLILSTTLSGTSVLAWRATFIPADA